MKKLLYLSIATLFLIACSKDQKAVKNLEGSWTRTAYKEAGVRSEEHTSELQSRRNLVCRLLLEKKNN